MGTRKDQSNRRFDKVFKGVTRTVSEPGRGSPIAETVNRVLRGEVVPGGRQPLPPGDYTNIPNLAESMTIARRAQERFEVLPSDIRDRFGNDPSRLNDFMKSEDEKDLEEAFDLGLRQRPKVVVKPPTAEELAANAAAAHAAAVTKSVPTE